MAVLVLKRPIPVVPVILTATGVLTVELQNDGWELDVDNDRPQYLASFQALFDRLFGMRTLGLLLPSDAVPAIDDALITTP